MLLLAVFCTGFHFTSVQAAGGSDTRAPWSEMDHGPFLSATLEAPGPGSPNLAYKAIIIPLKKDRSVNVAFDTDLLRYSAGWQGGFIDWKSVAFDGSHHTHPALVGRQLFGNHVAPGWANPADRGDFSDPRELPYGPLPRDRAHWKGLYLSGDRVVLAYTVGGTGILDSPGLLEDDGMIVFTRTIELERSEHDLVLQVCGGKMERWGDGEMERAAMASPSFHVSTLPSGLLLAAHVRAPAGVVWDSAADASLRLVIPASATPTRLKLLICGELSPKALAAFTRLAQTSSEPEALEPLTRGGPRRWQQTLTLPGRLGSEDGPFAIDALTVPHENPWRSWMRLTGLDFLPGGRSAVVCTWNGDVWRVDGLTDNLETLSWQRIATGLFQPLGIKVIDGRIYVLGRDQITRLRDLNGDGETDFYENFNNDHQVSEHFHEFAMDLQVGPEGDPYYMKAARHAKDALFPQHGTLLRVSPDGERTDIVCNGFRAPNGLAISPAGEMVTTDQEGHWLPMNRINWLEPGGFYGNLWSFHQGAKPAEYDPPLCWVPKWFDRSPAAPIWVDNRAWSPLDRALLYFSYGTGRLYQVLHEEVDGVRQGGVVALPVAFETGVMRGRFNPFDGHLYACGMFGSWGSDRTMEGGFYRVRRTAAPLVVPTGLNATRQGMVLTFSEPLDAAAAVDPQNYLVEIWNYAWTEQYGSDDYRVSDNRKGRDRMTVTGVRLSRDRRSVCLQIPDLQPCMQMQIRYNLRTVAAAPRGGRNGGEPVSQVLVNTINVLPDADAGLASRFEGGLSLPPPVPEDVVRMDDLRPGLALSLCRATRSGKAESEAPSDVREARLPALYVPEGGTPSSMLEPGPFLANWEGYLLVDMRGTYRLEPEGSGRFGLFVDGAEVIPLSDLPGPAADVELSSGLIPVRIRFIGGHRPGPAWLRLYWSGPDLPREPIPPTACFHNPSTTGIQPFSRLREGRRLLADHHCLRCHVPPAMQPGHQGLVATGMPELAADAPDLTGIGSRLHAEWMARWIEQPRAIRPDARMPRVLHGSDGRQQAADIAAYLASLHEPGSSISDRENRRGSSAGQQKTSSPPETAGAEAGLPSLSAVRNPPESRAERGDKLFRMLGCIACHTLGTMSEPDEHDRLRLDHVGEKWRPHALQAFMMEPNRHHRWTRMPDFNLTQDEAADLAAYLLANGTGSQLVPHWSEAGATLQDHPSPPDPGRGRELLSTTGCLHCHTLDGTRSEAMITTLDPASDLTAGCLAQAPDARGNAPDFGFDQHQRDALRAFARTGLASLRHRVASEFAERQIESLRCTACHGRDGQADTWSRLTSPSALGWAGAAEEAWAAEDFLSFDDEYERDEGEDVDDAGVPGDDQRRPTLTWSGEKLHVDWMARFLAGEIEGKPRAAMVARMPAYPAYASLLAEGLAHQHGLGSERPAESPPDEAAAVIGRELINVGTGFGCTTCHAVGGAPPVAGGTLQSVNFDMIHQRLRQEFYHRWMLDPSRLEPNTAMPQVADENGRSPFTQFYGGDGPRQFDAIWEYLRTLDRPEPPN